MSEDWEWMDCETKGDMTRYILGLRQDADELKENRSALGKIVHVIHTHVKSEEIPISFVKVCGSVGKETASSESSDLDLVVFIDNLEPNEIGDKIDFILDKIQQALDKQYPDTRSVNWYRKFGLRYMIDEMEIDILIGVPNVKPKDYLQYLDNTEQRAFLSASSSRYATNFIKKQGSLFKDMVRLLKDWRDSFRSWPLHCKPKSYLLEVLMLHAIRQGLPRFFSDKRNLVTRRIRATPNVTQYLLLQFMELVAGIAKYDKEVTYDKTTVSLTIVFDTYYNHDDIPWDTQEPLFLEIVRRKGKPSRKRFATAVVLDPANPTNNLWLTLGDPQTFIQRAKATAETMRKEQQQQQEEKKSGTNGKTNGKQGDK